MFYLVPFILAVLLGTLRSRQPKALMLWDLRAVFLLPLAFFFGLLPFWLATYWPDLIWTDDRQMLMVLMAGSRGLLLLFAGINLVPELLSVQWTLLGQGLRDGHYREALRQWPQRLRVLWHPRHLKRHLILLVHELWHDLKHLDIKLALLFSVHPRRVLAPGEQSGFEKKPANRLRIAGLTLAILALVGQIVVLLRNQGYWPLTERYLDHIADPLLIHGVRNGALRLQRLIDDSTNWAWLGQTLPWPDFTPHAFAKIRYLSPTEPLLATGLFLLTLSLFPARNSKQKRGRSR